MTDFRSSHVGCKKGVIETIENIILQNLRVSLVTIVIAYLLYAFLYAYIKRRHENQELEEFSYRHGCLPMEAKVPYRWPLALDVLKLQYDALPSQRLLEFQSKYFKIAPSMRLKLFGQTGYMTTDPKNIEAILSTRFEDFGLGSRRDGLYPMLGEGIFTQDGMAWKHSRETLRRQFVRMQYQNTKVFDKAVENLISTISSSGNTVVDLQPAFFMYTLTTTTSLIFGEPPDIQGQIEHIDIDQSIFTDSFDYASLISAMRIRLADLHWLYTPSKFKKACADVKRYAAYFVDVALKDLAEIGEEAAFNKYPFIIDMYRDLKDASLVRDQLVHVLIAGRDTTACLMSWTIFLLIRHPAALRRLCDEVTAVLEENEGVTRAQINKLPFLRCVLNETTRLYPQLPVNVRVATKTTLLPKGGGPDGQSPVLLPKGTGVGWSTYHMHRQTRIWGLDAEEFRPERWEESLEKKVGWGFLPFHGGPRICLGKDFALMEASYGIVRLLQAFPNIRLPPDIAIEATGQEKQSLTLVVSSFDGCKVVLD
ncbi:cytochrome P450 [Amylocarpus encephaloides]|uniref:Cytochrome P450 n=1 Tax=Amylocarpus encephaloides TaxID=45428 RepID=A0A9P7YD38_9HELO|nr:cytochrome P450 [Amylocarpus encephaloides]